MKTFVSGFKFGMMLQFAIGPITLLIFQISVAQGMWYGLQGMIGAGLADALLVASAILGLGALLNRRKETQKYLKGFGAAIMVFFGLAMVLGSLGIGILPDLALKQYEGHDSVVIKVFILTLANPMTILFWTGVFASRIAERHSSKKELWLFGGGAVMTTVFFQSLIALLGSTMKVFLNDLALTALNVLVGFMLIAFGIRLVTRQETHEEKALL